VKRIGIMLDWELMQKGIAGKRSYERLDYYVEIGKELGLEPVFFHPRHVKWKARKVLGHFWSGRRLIPRLVSIPQVIHNRVLSGQKPVRATIKKLSKHYQVYNGIVVRDKLRVHRLLWENPILRPFLPRTDRFTPETVERFLGKHGVFYVKPSIGSVGDGVLRVERQGETYRLISHKLRKRVRKHAVRKELRHWVANRRFLVQQGISLATYEDKTFDIRVSVQKNGNHVWCVSGMVAKVANAHNKLSNLARGGTAVPLNVVLSRLFNQEMVQQIRYKLQYTAIEIAKQYAKHFPSLADLGMDMGIDQRGNPFLIEVNVRDQRYSFYEAGEIELFRMTYRHPLEYGKSLMTKAKNKTT